MSRIRTRMPRKRRNSLLSTTQSWQPLFTSVYAFCGKTATLFLSLQQPIASTDRKIEFNASESVLNSTSANASQSYSVFEGQSTKWLRVPVPIDEYNHGMNGVDTASQIGGGFSVHRPTEVKWWRPIWYWILDICANNWYLL
jgi:hypothetical protein